VALFTRTFGVKPWLTAASIANFTRIYAAGDTRESVAHVWLVDPLLKTLEVFRLDGESYRMVHTWRGSVSVRAEPFDAIELELAILWAT